MLHPKSSSSPRVGSSAPKSQAANTPSRRWISGDQVRLDSAQGTIRATNLTARRFTDPNHGGLDSELAQVLAENLPQHAVVMLDPTGDIVRWNVGAEKLLGFTADEILGRNYTLLFATNDAPAPHSSSNTELSAESITESVAGKREAETFLVRRDGSTFPARLTFVPLGADHPGGCVGLIIHDVTERNRTDEQLRSGFVETAHLARLSTIGQMVAELAHEINQPLAAAANYARACVNFGRSGRCVVAPEALEWIDRCATQAMRAVRIAKRLGAFVKKTDGRQTVVQVNSLVEQAVVLVRGMLQGSDEVLEPITIATDFDPANPEITADPVQVEQVLLNLMRNAVEAMRELRNRRHVLTLRTTVEGSFVTIAVGDTGPGVAPDKLAGLFEPFFSTKPTGLGLGLSISRSIVEQHGGRMTVVSGPAGTVFSFTLPVPPGGRLPC